jgi:hypothetical protein
MKEVLEQQLQQLQGSSGEMRGIQGISDEIKRREEAIAKYSKALQSHARVFAAIREGWIFYTAIGDPIKQTLVRAQGFAAARELEALNVTEDIKRRQEERLRDLQEEEKRLEEERVRKEQLRAAEVKEEEKLLEEQRRLRAAHLQQAEEQRQREEAQRAQEEADMEYALHLASSGAQSVVRRSRDRDHQRSLQHQSSLHLDLGTQLPPLMPPPPPPDLSPLVPQLLPSSGGGGRGVGLVPSVMRRPKEPVGQGPDTSNDEAIARSLAGGGGTVKKRPVLQVDAGWSQADDSLARALAEELNMTTPDTRSGGGGAWHGSRGSAPDTSSDEEIARAYFEHYQKHLSSPKFGEDGTGGGMLGSLAAVASNPPPPPPAAAGGAGGGENGNGGGAQEVVLPSGWERKVDRNGNMFYIDHNTRTTHWDPPT